MGGKRWRGKESKIFLRHAKRGKAPSDILQALKNHFPNTTRSLSSVRGELQRLGKTTRLRAHHASTRGLPRPRFGMENTRILVILKDRFPTATWAQIATAFNACRQSGRSRTRDGVQKRYSRIDLVAVKSTITPSLERMVLEKASHVVPKRVGGHELSYGSVVSYACSSMQTTRGPLVHGSETTQRLSLCPSLYPYSPSPSLYRPTWPTAFPSSIYPRHRFSLLLIPVRR